MKKECALGTHTHCIAVLTDMAWREELDAVIGAVEVKLGEVRDMIDSAAESIRRGIDAGESADDRDIRGFQDRVQNLVFSFKALVNPLVHTRADSDALENIQRLMVSMSSNDGASSKTTTVSACADKSPFGSVVCSVASESQATGGNSENTSQGNTEGGSREASARSSLDHSSRPSLDLARKDMARICEDWTA